MFSPTDSQKQLVSKKIYMKKNILRFKLIIIGILIISINNVFANSYSDKNKIELLNSKNGKIVVKLNTKSFSKSIVNTPRGEAYIFNADNFSMILKKGAPALPKFTKSIIIPDMANMQVKIVDSKYTEIENVNIAPSKGNLYRDKDPNTIPYVYGKEYDANQNYPGELAELSDPYILRDYRGQTINFYPFQYNPLTKKLRIYSELTVELVENKNVISTINVFNRTKLKEKVNSEFDNIYKNHFLNYSTEGKYTVIEDEGNMLIIAPAEYMSAMSDFVAWKKQRGLAVELVQYSTVGSTATDVETYVENYYNANGLTFLLLIGDAEDIPSMNKSGDSDAAYGHIVGNDSYAEVFVGRFSAESVADVQTQVMRVIHYERDITTADTWFETAVGIASDQGGVGQGDDDESDAEHMDNIRTDLLNYGYSTVDQSYDDYGATASDVANSVNTGRSLINYVGHGSDYSWVSTGFEISDVNSLTNENKLPYIFDVACVNGNFHGQTCFAEAWMRATNNSNPTGAISIIASTINQSWAPPMDGQDEMDDILVESYVENIKRTYGGIAINGCMHMNDEYGADGAEMTDTWTIFGDPSLLVRTKNPSDLSISHNDAIFIGSEQFVVNGNEDAFVSLTIDGEIIGTAKIQGGSATVSFDALTEPGNMKVTVTGYNKIVYIADVEITPANTPYITLDSYVIDDASGNVNGLVDFAETLNLDVTLKNVSDTYDALNVETTLSTSDANVSISDATETYGTIAASGSLAKVGAYNISINNDVEDQHVLNFDLTITGEDASTNSYTWNSNINLTVNAPVLEIGDMTIDDSATGNNDGILDPGETATVNVVTTNSGHADITNVVGVLTIEGGSSPYLTIDNGTTSAYPLVIDEEGIASFEVTADAGTPVGTPVDMDINLTGGTSNQYSDMNGKVIIIGEIPEYTIDQEGTVSTCVGLFYDSGSSTEEYSNSENYTMTFESATVGKNIQANFINFDVESNATCNYDKLSIYNGTSSSADLIGEYCGTTSPGVVTASNSDGALTFVFTSDGSVTKSGWEAEISCVDAYDVTFVVSDVYGFVNGATVSFNGEEKSTNASGEAVFTNIIEGDNLPYIISALGHEEYSSNLNLLGDITETVDLVLSTYDITFNVFDEDGTTPLDGDVTFNGSTLSTTNGTVTFVSVPYELGKSYSVDVPLYEPYNGSIDVDAEKSEDVTMTLITWDVTFVVDDGTDPIVGAIIEFNGEELATEASGEVIFTHVPPGPKGDFPYTVRKSGYGNESGIVSVTNSNVTVPVTMTVGTATYKVSFNVTDGVNPIEGANVNFNSEDVLTNSEGYAEFLEVSEGTDLTYTVSKIAYFNSTGTVDVAGANVSEDVLLTIIPYDVTFIVTDGTNPIEGASINFHGETLTSNASGECVFVDIDPEATLTYIITKLGFDDVSSSLDVVDQDVTENVTMNVSTYDITFDVREDKGATLNADVSFNGTTQTCVNGLTTFTDVEYGLAQEYSVETDGYESITDAVDVNANKTVNVRMLIITYDITFAVTAEDGTTPVEAEVSFNGITQTATEGTTIFTGIEYELAKSFTMSAEGFYDTTATIDVDANKTIEVSMNHICYSVSFNVEDVDDNALEGVNVSFNSTNQLTDSEGSTTFTDVIPGDGLSYTLTKDGYNDITSSLNLTNSNVSLNITMTSSVGIESLSDLGISIYPNPASNFVNIVSDNLGSLNVSFTDISGKTVLQTLVENRKTVLDISDISSGIYIINIKSGKKIYKMKFIKQ